MINDNSLQLLGQITSNENITGFIENGLKGLDYEEGIYIPEEDIATPTITFVNSHNEVPIYISLFDTGTDFPGANVSVAFNLVNSYAIFGSTFPYRDTSVAYGYIANIRTFSNYSSTSGGFLTRSSDLQTYATKENFKPYVNSCSWKAGRTYKWIAVWK